MLQLSGLDRGVLTIASDNSMHSLVVQYTPRLCCPMLMVCSISSDIEGRVLNLLHIKNDSYQDVCAAIGLNLKRSLRLIVG